MLAGIVSHQHLSGVTETSSIFTMQTEVTGQSYGTNTGNGNDEQIVNGKGVSSL